MQATPCATIDNTLPNGAATARKPADLIRPTACGTLQDCVADPPPPLLAISIILTALTGLAFIGIAVGTLVANSRLFGVGVAAVLIGYGAMLIAAAWFTLRQKGWALGLIVASSLLHVMVVGSFLTTADRAQFVGSLVVAPFVLATLVASVLAVGRRELDKV